jgi:glycosyltransferase involved in cell wall biosynthesis
MSAVPVFPAKTGRQLLQVDILTGLHAAGVTTEVIDFGRNTYSKLGIIELVKYFFRSIYAIFKVIFLPRKKDIDCVVSYAWDTFVQALVVSKIIMRKPFVSFLVDVFSRRASGLNDQPMILNLAVRIQKLCSLADRIVILSEEDRQVLSVEAKVPERKIDVIPLSLRWNTKIPNYHCDDLIEIRKLYDIPNYAKIVIFHGSLTYFPNRRALEVIAQKIEPAVKEKRKDIIFIVAGPYSEDMQGTFPNNVKILGFVPDIRLLICASDIAICPLEAGEGMKNKILDYLVCRKPVIATPIAARGFGEAPLIICEKIDQFAEKILSLVENPSLAEEIGRRGQLFATTRLGPTNYTRYGSIVRGTFTKKITDT